jgi:predicted ATP-dependent endonuclease of OLD family
MVKMKDSGLNISAIQIEDFEGGQFYQEYSGNFDLTNLSKINIFIGKNNSGKSRLIRNIFQNRITSAEHKIYSLNHVKELIIERYKDSIHKNHPNSNPLNAIFGTLSFFQEKLLTFDRYNSNFFDLLTINNLPINPNIDDKDTNLTHVKEEVKKSWSACIDKFNQSEEYLSIIDTLSVLRDQAPRIYIPMLRGMRSLTDSIEIYKNRTSGDYRLSTTGSRQLFTGLEIYQNLQEKLLGKPDGRKQVKKYEEFLSDNFFNQEIVTLIPSLETKCIEIQIGNEDQFPIYHLGDGLQTIIIVTFPIFMAKEPSLFFIEEPDLAMHPSMQRALIQAMLDKKEHQYFLTTHSNHFLDMALESDNISIFQVKKEIEEDKTKFKITHATAILKSVFEDLGIRNSSVLLANCTIWVEGVTDKLYLKAYMKKYLQELSLEDTEKHKKYDLYKEDLHYIFAEYQGSNIVHWDFSNREQNDDLDNEGKKTTLVEALCGNALLIADGDIDNKGTRVADLTQIMGERFILLEAKEIENYIPSSILKETVKLR